VEYKEIAVYLLLMVQALVIYIFNDKKNELKIDIIELDKKILKIETGEFVEKIVKNVIYLPETRNYFKSIFNEALDHKGKNNDSVSLAILDELKTIGSRLDEKK
jgi:hypothetical protein